MNNVSSRSHTIFSILCDSLNTHTGVRSMGKLSFIDLAVGGEPSRIGINSVTKEIEDE